MGDDSREIDVDIRGLVSVLYLLELEEDSQERMELLLILEEYSMEIWEEPAIFLVSLKAFLLRFDIIEEERKIARRIIDWLESDCNKSE